LYVGGVEAVKGTQATLIGPGSGLYIGAGKNLEEGSFFSGLMDDTRIHNVAVIAKEIEEMSR
jgi:hypothetical protein